MKTGELFWFRVAINVQLPDLSNLHQYAVSAPQRVSPYLLWVGQYRFELAQEHLRADVLVEVADPDREFLGLELLDGLDEDLCGIVSDCICACDLASTHRLASWSAGRAHS